MRTITYSLHKITEADSSPFEEQEYSRYKFGVKFYAEKFAKDLFAGFLSEFKEVLISVDEIIILPSPYLAIPTSSNFLCNYFKKELDKFLFHKGKRASIESKIYRNQTYVTDRDNLLDSRKLNLVSNDSYYIDRSFINGKFCIFLDDIKITGQYEQTVKKNLEKYNVCGDFVFVYFAELANVNTYPNIEIHYDYFDVKNVFDIISIIKGQDFQYNSKIVKYILSLGKKEFTYFINNISEEERDELFYLAISNNYHRILEFETNIDKIKIDLNFNVHF